MTTKELFALAGTIRGAMWLHLFLTENASDVANKDGWVSCAEGRPSCRHCVAEILGAPVDCIDRLVERLIELNVLRCTKLGVAEVFAGAEDHAESSSWIFWIRKDFLLATGSMRPQPPATVN